MTRPENVAEAQRLRAQGLTYREIGERMGVPLKTASSWVLDPLLSSQRARRVRYSRPCVDCGAPTDGSGGYAHPCERCAKCAARRIHETRYWTQEAIIGAIQCWADEYGGIPPSAPEWLGPVPRGYPPVSAVQREFGSWNAAIAAAGYSPRGRGKYGRDGEDMELCLEIRERYEAGESLRTLMSEYECGYEAIAYRVQKAGGKRHSRSEAQRRRWAREAMAA